MIESAVCKYGIRALVSLAGEPKDLARSAAEISKREQIPSAFLVKILARLRQAGLLVSVRGRRGGFVLARPPEEIMMLEVVEALEGPGAGKRCALDLPTCDDRTPCPVHTLYKRTRETLRRSFAGTNLRQLAEEVDRKSRRKGRSAAE